MSADNASSQFFPIVQSFCESHGSFGRFWKLLKSSNFNQRLGPKTPSSDLKGVQLFPSLLVLPAQVGESKGARRRARRRGRSEAWCYAEMLWAYFTFLHGGSPHKHCDQQRLLSKAAANPWTSLHATYSGSLHDQINRYIRLQCDDAPLSRGILKLSELVKLVRNSDYTHNLTSDKLSRVAKPVKPERMSLPSVAGIIEPSHFLKGHHLDSFNAMATEIPHGIEPDNPTVGCFKVEPEDLHAVNRKLLTSGVAALIPEELAMRDSRGNIISGGLFAVDHKPTSDRVILDRRPFNELERRLVWARLPHGSLLTQLIVPKGYSIRGSGDDLSNYFYLLKHRPDWLHRNTVGQSFDGEGYEEFGGVKGKKFLLSFQVIAMGDLNAVDIAQQVHLEILRDGQCMAPNECIEFKHPLPASHTLEGLYTDDHIITQILPSKKNRPPKMKYRDEELLENSRRQYARHSIPTSDSKAFSKASNFVAWGTEVDSRSGRVGAPLIKLRQLANLLSAVCKLKVVSKKLLQGITGLLVHPFMHRRNMMCLLQDTFLWIESLGDEDRKPLPTSVREELLSCGLVLPLCHSNIRWPISCRLGASDASLSHGGRAATLVTPAIAQTLYRYAEHKGEHVRLDWARGAVQPPSEMRQAPQELEELVADLPWNKTETCSFAHRQHINILEARMIHRELMDLVHQSSQPLRAVLLVDSRAAAGAWSKGRSSARNLNRVLRQALGWTLVGQKSIHLVWVRSGSNPSDYPSRCKRIPDPPSVPSSLTQEILGSELNEYRTRHSNRDIWRKVKQQGSDQTVHEATTPADVPRPCSTDRKTAVRTAASEHPASKKWTFREVFAGSAHLTKTFRERGVFNVLPPVELMKNGKVDPTQNILDDKVFAELCEAASKPHQLWHFGFPCGSFSIMQNMNKGTRSSDNPLGNNSLQRERIGNEILRRTVHLCDLLSKHGSFFTMENPLSSFAWKIPFMLALSARWHCTAVTLDQCMFGLKIPDQSGNPGLAKKPTNFLGNMPNLDHMSRKCSHGHGHVAVLGGVKVGGKWHRRSTLAGSYPRALCLAYAKAFEQSFA